MQSSEFPLTEDATIIIAKQQQCSRSHIVQEIVVAVARKYDTLKPFNLLCCIFVEKSLDVVYENV